MSQSPVQLPLGGDLPQDFTAASERLDELAQRGVSWSGYERNCAFLNLRQGSFSNISSAVGFDFLDDGRAVGVVDWDHDGDLDLWLANRTSPRLRMLRNDVPSGNHFLAVKLTGRSCNRDAIGARIVLTMRNAASGEGGPDTELAFQTQPTKVIRTLRAGEGFLAQSSKWLYFGLGSTQHIERLVVHWPGGDAEEFANVAADRHYQITQGSGRAKLWTPPARRLRLTASTPEIAKPGGDVQVLLRSRVPLPPMDYQTSNTDTKSLAGHHGKPLLVNLWASWCQPCLHELNSLTNNQRRLRDAGVDVLALSVDGLTQDRNTDIETAELLLQKMDFPFSTGRATAELVDKLQLVHDQLFLPKGPLPVPTSILIDASGHLAAMYKGTVTVDRIVNDVNKLSYDRIRLTRESLPFQGMWHDPPNLFWHSVFGLQLAESGYLDDAIKYAVEHRRWMTDDPHLPRLLTGLGNKLMNRGDLDDAVTQYRTLLDINPTDARSNYNLGLALVKQNKLEQAVSYFRKAIKADPQHAKAHNNLGNILVRQNKSDQALQHFLKALHANPEFVDAHVNIAPILISGGDPKQALQHLRRALKIQPGNGAANYHMANVLVSQGKSEEAIPFYQRSVEANSDFAEAHNNLGVALRLQGLLDQSLEHAQKAVQIRPQYAEAHQNLAMLLMARKQGAEAIKHFRTAVRLVPNDDNGRLNLGMALAMNGQLNEAVRQLSQAIELNPANAQAHYRLGSVLAGQHNFDRALIHHRRAAELNPDWVAAIRSMAWILATHPNEQRREPERALKLAKQAARLSGNKNAVVLDTLAAAYASAGQYDRAVSIAQAAIKIASSQPASPFSNQVHERLQRYQQRKPYISE